MDKLTFDFHKPFRLQAATNSGKNVCGTCRHCRSCRSCDYDCKSNRSQNEPQDPGEDGSEFYIQWHITHRCTQQCKHCYGETGLELGDNDLLRIAEKLLTFVETCDRKLLVVLTGGEPLLRPETVIRLVKSLGATVRCELLSTGHPLHSSPDLLPRLKALQTLKRIQFSLDGPRSVHDAIRSPGSFDSTLQALKLVGDAGFETALMMTLSKRNAASIVEVHEIANDLWGNARKRLGFDRFTPCGQSATKEETSQVCTKEEFKAACEAALAWRAKHGWGNNGMFRPLHCLLDPEAGAACSVGISGLTIMPDGVVYPCRRLPVSLGNALHDDLLELWLENSFLNKMRNPTSVAACVSCQHLHICRGCRAAAYAMSGDAFGSDPHCWQASS